MPSTRYSFFSIIVILCFSLSGCIGIFKQGACHENFKNVHQSSVGKSLDDPGNLFTAYRKYFEEYQAMADGNLEYIKEGRGSCRVFYEVDHIAGKVVAWRFEGTPADCEICP